MEARISNDMEQGHLNLWYKCSGCQEFSFKGELERNLYTCSYCGALFPLLAEKRVEYLLDDAPETEIASATASGFAVEGTISEYPACLFIVDIEVSPTNIDIPLLLTTLERGLQKQIPLITIVSCQSESSGRASTGFGLGIDQIHSLSYISTYLTMQMERLADASIPHITVLTETEAYPLATSLPLGELVIAEGSTPLQKQTSSDLQPALHAPEEQLLTQGPASDMGGEPDISVDCYVPRTELPDMLGRLLKFFSG